MLIVDIYKFIRGKLKRKQGGDMPENEVMNPVEYFIRELVGFIKEVGTMKPLEIVNAVFKELMGPAYDAIRSVKGKTEDEVRKIIGETLDNLIGTEDDAVIGPNEAALFGINIPLIGDVVFEKLTDIIIGVISGPIADAIVPDEKIPDVEE